MRTNHLCIQRGKFKAESQLKEKGIDTILQFDYMGSSEFEFGNLPKSLDRIRSVEILYTYMDVPVSSNTGENKVVTAYCKNSEKSEIKAYLQGIAESKFSSQEHTDFDNYINPGFIKSRTDFWWDIQNDIMFWRKDVDFETKFKQLIIKQ